MEQRHKTTLERMREHLARADSELEAAQHFLDPETHDEDEMAFVRATPTPGPWWKTLWRPRGGGLRRQSVSRLCPGTDSPSGVLRS
jgi:hypothetical protein